MGLLSYDSGNILMNRGISPIIDGKLKCLIYASPRLRVSV